ncbi:MAG: FkbM family methyltransferase [Alphaproteobacteria bacterium]|nr:FkbM family methyltransferase [Alphaproteobacteria bacterium]
MKKNRRKPKPKTFAENVSSSWVAFKKQIFGEFDDWFKKCRGIIHVGANEGQERRQYAELGLNVLWIEPIPNVYEKLCKNIEEYPRQRALKALVTDQENKIVTLNISSNAGASSSIYDFALHKDIWPDVTYVDRIEISSTTLPALILEEGVHLPDYDGLLLDTQGSEYLILKGAQTILNRFKYIQVEAADFESYKGAATTAQITDFLKSNGFRPVRKHKFAEHASEGAYYDLLFKLRG